MNILELKNISFSYGDKMVIRHVSLGVKKGEILGILGPNGAGKSTLLKLMSGVFKPIRGDVILENRSLRQISAKEIAKFTSVVPQTSQVPFAYSALEIVLMGRAPHLSTFGFETKRDLRVALDAMERTDCTHFNTRDIHELSGGERQRVILARALAQEPQLLLLDEPTTFLDIRHTKDFARILKNLRDEERITIVCALHDLNLAASLCDRIVLLKEGEVVAGGNPKDVINCETISSVFDSEIHIATDNKTGIPYYLP